MRTLDIKQLAGGYENVFNRTTEITPTGEDLTLGMKGSHENLKFALLGKRKKIKVFLVESPLPNSEEELDEWYDHHFRACHNLQEQKNYDFVIQFQPKLGVVIAGHIKH